jgi:putative endonuclease
MAYFVYILQCVDGTFYTGTTNNIEKRLLAHNTATSKTAAKYTRSRRPVVLKYVEKKRTKGAALKREHAIKQLTRAAKLAIMNP